MADLKKGARITGTARDKLATELKKKYDQGASIRALAESHGAQGFTVQLIASFFWGYAFIHYHLDAHIWRVRRDPAVGRALRME